MAAFLHSYHADHWLNFIAVMTVLGSVGAVNNWIVAPTKGLWHASNAGKIPAYFSKTNKQEIPHVLLILQALIVSGIALIYTYMPSINAAYWLLSGGAVELYMVMYLLMFIAALTILITSPSIEVFGGRTASLVVVSVGLFGSLMTMLISLIPPAFMHMSMHIYMLI